MTNILTAEQLEALKHISTCRVADAIETFQARLRNEGFVRGGVKCFIPRAEAMVGYAVTGRIRSANPPMRGTAILERRNWWEYVLSVPQPRIVVLEDEDEKPGTGAFWDAVHVSIHLALGCVGTVTNGAVRDLSEVEPTGFHYFGGRLSVSHAYVHITDFGNPVEVGGLKISSGDLLHGDRDGILSIPHEIAATIPATAAEVTERNRKLIEMCHSTGLSLDKLYASVNEERYRVGSPEPYHVGA